MSKIVEKRARAYSVKIYIAGPIEIAKQILRRECLSDGLCVTIDPTQYIYTGGEESGYVVGLINYPRFPTETADLTRRATELGRILMEETFQQSFTVATPDESIFFSRRPADVK